MGWVEDDAVGVPWTEKGFEVYGTISTWFLDGTVFYCGVGMGVMGG